jgi:hypothetical protein
MFELDPESIDRLNEEQHRELLVWLRDLVTYVENKLGIPKIISKDPIMERIIADHKVQQRKMARVRPGWMSVGLEKVDDKHV